MIVLKKERIRVKEGEWKGQCEKEREATEAALKVPNQCFFRQLLPPGPLFDFSTVTFLSANQHGFFGNLHKNALLGEKHPCGAFGPTIR